MNFIKKTLISISILFLYSCSSSNNNWECPLAKSGKSCKSISEADSNIKEAKILVHNEDVNKNLLKNSINGIKLDDINPIRTQEKIGKILITPYVNKEGNLNSGKYIYTIDQKAEWKY